MESIEEGEPDWDSRFGINDFKSMGSGNLERDDDDVEVEMKFGRSWSKLDESAFEGLNEL